MSDALATIGTLDLPEDAARDAVHMAVMPAIAGETLLVGNPVSIKDGMAWYDEVNYIGIVDPFLEVDGVGRGRKFWLMIKPRTITGLRHSWSHPALEDEVIGLKEGSYVLGPDEYERELKPGEYWVCDDCHDWGITTERPSWMSEED